MNGIELIAAERRRQIEIKGYDAAHDDAHDDKELALAAACYAVPVPIFMIEFCGDRDTHEVWPWDADAAEKRDDCSELRRLAIAGALIAAEIDRLIRNSEVITS